MPEVTTSIMRRTILREAVRETGEQRTPPERGIDPPESGLAFHLYRARPGHPDWTSVQREAIDLARRLGPALERPRLVWREIPRRLRSYATAAQNYLTNRRLVRAGHADLRPLYFIWTVLRTCNFRCTYCDDHRGQRYPELPKDGTLTTPQGRALLRIMRSRTPSVYFSGGEPTMRKDLPELTRFARDLAYYPIVINTNGSIIDRLLELPAWRTWLADTDIVVVSLDALDLETLGRMWVTPQPARVIRNLLLLRILAAELRVKLMVNTVIQPGLIGHARDVLDFANDLGIWFCPVPMNTGPTVHGALRDDNEYAALTDLILERKRAGYPISGSERMLRRLLHSDPLTCFNTLKPHVDHDGHLFWPCKASVSVAPASIDVMQFDNVDQLYAHAAARIDPAGFHGPGPQQCGADCNWAQNYTTDTYAYGLRHPWSLVGDVAEFLDAR